MSQEGKYIKGILNKAKNQNQNPVQIGQIQTLKPLEIDFQGITISLANGDTIYINDLWLDENIDLDVPSMDIPQNITGMEPPPLIKIDPVSNPDYTAYISGTQKQFLIDFYMWTKEHHDRFILHEGDYVTVQKLGNNTYLVIEKVQKIGE